MKVTIDKKAEILGGVEYNFNKPINVLVGGNGTGKSSLLKAISQNIKEDWELSIANKLSNNLIELVPKPSKVSYYFVENDEKHKMSHFGDDMFAQLGSMKSSSGEATLQQVLRALTNKESEVVILDEPDSSLDIMNSIVLEELLPRVVNKDKGKIVIMSIHSRSLLENLSLHKEVNIIDILTGDILDVNVYIKEQQNKALEKLLGK